MDNTLNVLPFYYRHDTLHCDSVPLPALAAEFGTPLYVYSASRLRENYRRLGAAFAGLQPTLCYSVKANSNLALLSLLKDEGASFDIVSGGELFRTLRIGADPNRIVFAGVGKTEAEIEAALRAGVGWINIESVGELHRVNRLAQQFGTRPNIALRLRPDLEADTHPHLKTGAATSKFGLPLPVALDVVHTHQHFTHVHLRGIHIHVGSQLSMPQTTLQAIEAALEFIARARSLGAAIDMLDIGGGFPVAYHEDDPPLNLETYAAPIVARLEMWRGQLYLEPGRSIVADAGALLTSVQYEKLDPAGQLLTIVDAGLQTLIRPALYGAYHRVWPVRHSEALTFHAGVAGPICESADFLAHDRMLPLGAAGDLLAILDAGAYGASMASNYNSHPLPAEVLVEGGTYRLIRKRQSYADLIANEIV